ncbi:MAG: DUF58 domain-containing protein [Microthrixaceae bacterium]|nr:DUF58 domain-containing protein [Microthrixaceae bacterium]
MARRSSPTADAPLASPMGDRRSADVLRRLEIDVNRRLDGILHGDHRGLVPGHGSEPGEAREYQAGDDVRRIDWNVTARMNDPHIRESVADRELETWIVADRSASLDFGTVTWEKRDLVLAAAAGVGFLTSRGGNRIGAIVSGSDGVVTVPARQGRKHLLSVLHQIQGATRADAAPPMDLAGILKRAASVSRRRSLVVVISDWLDEPESWRHALATLGVRHEVLCIEVVDPRELALPKVGVLTLIDTETGRTREIDTNNKGLRERYAAAAADQRAAIHLAIAGTGAHHLRLRTDSDWLLDLARHVASTKRRQANVGGHP